MSLYRGHMDLRKIDPFGTKVLVKDDPKSKIDLDQVTKEVRDSCKGPRAVEPWNWGSTSRTYPEALDWICKNRNLSPQDIKSTVYKGCVGITETLIGKNLMFPRDYQHCFDTLKEALEFKSELIADEFCKDEKNTCGKPSKPVIFGFTWNQKKAREDLIEDCIQYGKPIPKWGEFCPTCGVFDWNGESPIRRWPWDFGYYLEDRDLICHATRSESAGGCVKFSIPMTYEYYEECQTGCKTIYCVTCEGNSINKSP
jgi:hypothetical protein